ncbi:MAG: redoxin domain-containing protein [Alphaproteobacteria bacterium]|nr:redoxin domain-containing protein [Alphaproteobacteria bacterium]MBU1516787.1 redoxin domain-containing protein [Alphaproteobacteria bacterium]MBU2092481.1 redoxin domain-containing protein [Alphaproteobacteria bacterium]MBU2152388.1 redoxin domain-containing protein [Alphaproteobacteria bacterium]MBU2305599.1 redoxin domain-containing protein [Alphaproteobacteria bacterium]
MRRTTIATALGLALTASLALAATPKAPVAAVASAPGQVDNFRLVTATGHSEDLYRYHDAKAVVLVMHAVGSPEFRRIAPGLQALTGAYGPKGVPVMLLNSTAKDSRAAVLAEAKTLGLTLPVLMDDNLLVGDQLGATRVSEVFVIDPRTWKVAYHGPLNDGAKGALAADAVDALIAGKPVAVASAPATGAMINFPDRSPAAKAAFEKISYSKTIVPILESKCVACHQEGGIAPFAMNSYAMVKGFAPMIRETIRTDRMPPWDVDPKVGHFKNDKSLTPDEIKTLVRWVEAGAPRGDGPDRLATTKHVAPEWPLGKPDLIVDIPSYKIPASGVVDYQYPVMDNPLTEGRWLKASTARVNQRQAVHHILSGYIPPGQDKLGGMANWGGSVGGYTVGMESIVQPTGIGSYIPGGGSIGYQMHYTPFGKEVLSTQQIGLYFYKPGETPKLMMRENTIVQMFIKIPPNTEAHEERAYLNFPHDALLYSAVVHAHYRGTYSDLKIRYPDGTEKQLLNVPRYDFNWQRMYEFAEPIKVPAGSKLIATYIYDNSKRNPANPDPNKEVVWGDQSFEEMFFTQLRYRWVDETAAKQTTYDDEMMKTRLIGMMDANIDGKIQIDELKGDLGNAIRPKFALVDTNKDGGIDAKEFEPILKMMGGGARKRPAAVAAK